MYCLPLTINATVFTAAIRIDRLLESNIGRIVGGDNGAGRVAIKNGGRRDGLFRIEMIAIRLELDFVEPIRNIRRSPAALNNREIGNHVLDTNLMRAVS
jgi:hypothetical protein